MVAGWSSERWRKCYWLQRSLSSIFWVHCRTFRCLHRTRPEVISAAAAVLAHPGPRLVLYCVLQGLLCQDYEIPQYPNLSTPSPCRKCCPERHSYSLAAARTAAGRLRRSVLCAAATFGRRSAASSHGPKCGNCGGIAPYDRYREGERSSEKHKRQNIRVPVSPVPGLTQGLGTTGPARGPRRSSRPLWGRGKHSCRLERGAAKLSILACAWTCFEAWRCSESLFEAPGRTSWLWEGTPWLRCACASAWPRGHSAF